MRAADTSDMQGVPVYEGTVLADWIDINGHMNVAYYVLAFDLGVDKLWHEFGITDEYIRTENGSTFAVESHVTYRNELKLDEPFVITSQVLAFDTKRIHQFMRMYHADDGYLAATAEWMNLHVDMTVRRVSRWPEFILRGIERFVAEQGEWPYPDDAGRRMSVRAPVFRVTGYR